MKGLCSDEHNINYIHDRSRFTNFQFHPAVVAAAFRRDIHVCDS
jgi:hypothetical protein